MLKKFLQEQSGRTMLEAIGYISVMIAVTIALTATVNSGYDRFRTGRINQQLVDLKKVISQRYVAAENYKDVSFQTLVDEKIVPHDMVGKHNRPTHAFGGFVSIGKAGNNELYVITFQDVPQKACIELGSKLWVVNDGSDLYSMTINSITWAWNEYNPDFFAGSIRNHLLPATVADVSKACNQKSNNIRWSFN